MKNETDAHVIRTPKEARALAAPVRQEIVDALEHAGACTIAELAAHLERAPDGLYFHVRALERAGLVRRVGEKGTGRAKAALFDVPGRPMRMDYSGSPRARVARVGPTLDGILRLAHRDTKRALADGGACVEGEARDLWVARARGRVGREDLVRINGLLAECARIVRESRGGEGTTPVALAFALTPIQPGRRAAGATTSTRSKA
jgi:DNA-binding transcriptional ArsR family regulator